MRQAKEVLRLRQALKLPQRQVAQAVGLSASSIANYEVRAKAAGLTWDVARDLTDEEVESRLFAQVEKQESTSHAPIDLAWVHREMRRTAVTLQLLWTEYADAVRGRNDGAQPYQYSRFCDAYAQYRRTLSPVMRQTHRAGEKVFLDYSGKRPSIVDPLTGEVADVELYVAVMGASNYTYAEAARSQQLGDFVSATVRAFEFFGAVPEVAVPDQLRSAVSRPCRYEPEINATFAEMGAHYGCVIVPARPRKPRDKAKVETGVQIAQRWILASLRHRTFFSLEELNAAIRELLVRLNARPFTKMPGCRRSEFETVDRPAMKALPATRYEYAQWKFDVGVPPDYLVEFDERRYSVPVALQGRRVDIRATTTAIEVFHKSERVASHVRLYGPKREVTIAPEHRPRSHEDYGAWPPERFIRWATSIGPNVGALFQMMLTGERHPELRYRSCLGILRLAKKYGNDRADAACRRAVAISSASYRSVATILKHNLDRAALPGEVTAPGAMEAASTPGVTHENVRGADYFDRKEDT